MCHKNFSSVVLLEGSPVYMTHLIVPTSLPGNRIKLFSFPEQMMGPVFSFSLQYFYDYFFSAAIFHYHLA